MVEPRLERSDDDGGRVDVRQMVGIENQVVVEGVVDVLAEIFEDVVFAATIAAGDFLCGFGGGEFVDFSEIADANLKGSDKSNMESRLDVARDEISSAPNDHRVAGLGETEDRFGGFCDAGVNAGMQAEGLAQKISQLPGSVFGKKPDRAFRQPMLVDHAADQALVEKRPLLVPRNRCVAAKLADDFAGNEISTGPCGLGNGDDGALGFGRGGVFLPEGRGLDEGAAEIKSGFSFHRGERHEDPAGVISGQVKNSP